MAKKLVFIVLVTLMFTGVTSGEIYYSINAEKDSLRMNSTVKMSCEAVDSNCPVNVWTVTLNKPENSTIRSVESSIGEVNQYDVSDTKLTIETTSDKPTESVSVRVNYKIGSKADHIKDDLYYHQIGLPGFQGERNSGEIKADDMMYADVSYGFKSSLEDDKFRFSGSGPTNAGLNFGEGYKTEYFEFFGEEPESAEKAYKIPAGILGFHHRFSTLPVVILSDREYNKTLNRWSRGQYSRGMLLLRENLGDEFLPILAHETVHALNDEPLEWDQTDSSYFDEGTAKYVESMVRKTGIDHPARELFGEDVSYTRQKNGKQYRYTLPSKGDREKLWQYYQRDSDFMKVWRAESTNRAFGYAYSELIIRNYIANENGSIKELYSEVDRQEKVEDPEKKWAYYSEQLDMTPCKYNSRDRFEECLDNINEYDYPIYTAEPRTSSSSILDIEKINVSKPEIDEAEGSSSQKIDQDIIKKGFNQTSNFDRKDITDMNQEKGNARNNPVNKFLNEISRSIQKLVSNIFYI